MRMRQGQHGNRQVIPRIHRLLEQHGVRATFFCPPVSALLDPDELRALAKEGHEIGIHSWIHEANVTWFAAAERDLTFRAADTLERIASRRQACAPRRGTSRPQPWQSSASLACPSSLSDLGLRPTHDAENTVWCNTKFHDAAATNIVFEDRCVTRQQIREAARTRA
jgi:peptidoglycan/xylan/chitin deacetylase (PgdA/CDA1 family)